jgi:hypothetical protein
MKTQILFLNQSSGYLMVDIVNAFKGTCKERILVAGSVLERNHKLDRAVKWEHIVAYDRSSTGKRLFTWVWGFLQALWLVWWKYPKAHLFLVSNPPFATLIPLFCKNPYSLLIYDIYPDALVEYRILKAGSWPIRLWQSAHRRIFRQAAHIFTITESMQERLKSYAGEKPVQVVPVWADGAFIKPVAKANNPFIREQGLEGKFVVLYSGNLGRTHEVAVLVDTAARMQHPDVFFLIIGGGEKQRLIEEKIAGYGLENCRFLPWQPVEMLPYTLAAADLGVVSLGKEAATLSIPSKTFSLLSAGVPLLCLADPESELASLVGKHAAGACFMPQDVDHIVDFIEGLATQPKQLAQYALNARKASENYSPDNVQLFASAFRQKVK